MDDNIHNLRDALEWLDRRIREEAEYDGEMTNEHAIQLGFITNMLEKFPLRQCDVGTAEEQSERFRAFCQKCKMPQFAESAYCAHECSCRDAADCKFAWAQTPYEAEEGAGI